MIKISSKNRGWLAVFAMAMLASACGGRTLGDPSDDNGDDAGSSSTTPVPTCDEICGAAVDQCFPGASTAQCSSDCEKMRSDYKGCTQLDAFLRCMPKVPVICTKPDKVEFNGCNAERDDLVRCHS